MQDLNTLIKNIQDKLQSAATLETKIWFENYLKGVISYYGVKTPQVKSIVHVWRKENELMHRTLEEQLTLCKKLISLKYAEEKFAATLYIQQHLVKKIDLSLLLDTSEEFYSKEYFWDWSTADWFTVRVLSAIIAKDSKSIDRIASWADSTSLWQRRASIVALRKVVSEKKYHSLIEKVIDKLVNDSQRFIQTGIGWTLSDLSKKHATVATRFVEKHFSYFSVEVIDRHTKYLSKHKEWKKLKRNK